MFTYYSMRNKLVLILILFFLRIGISFSQEYETVLSSPDNWQGEIIPFPLGFAQEIDFEGFEDLRFSPGWNDPNSQEFWTYMFVWYVEKVSPMTESKLTEYFNLYYDGLMGIDDNNRDTTNSNQLDKTICLFVKTDEGFDGKMRTYDRFFTKDYITLNIKVKESFCPETNKQIIRFDISPKDFDHEVWGIFDDVSLKVKCN
jgi:hypothetical protein